MKFKDEISRIYDSNPEYEWERLERHRTEFAVTLQAMEEHLPLFPAKILDCGGGPGRYAIELTKRGYSVTLLDLSEGNLTLAQKKAAEAGVELQDFTQGTATDLSRYNENSFDAILLMGPLYHLLDEKDRCQAIAECHRILKPGGTLMAAFITRYAPIKYCIPNEPTWPIENPELFKSIYEQGIFPPRGERDGEFVAYFAHPMEVSPLISSQGFEVETVLGVEGLASEIEEGINQLTGEAWDFWADFNYKVSADPSIHGGVEHLLVVATKPKWRSILKEVATKLNKARIPYKVVGGTLAALYGIPVKVNDLDIEFSTENVYRAEEILAEFMSDRVSFKENEIYRSHIGHLEIDGHLVDIFGNLERKQGDQWVSAMASTEAILDLEGVPVMVPWLEEEVLAYMRRGKLERASLCLPYCDPERFQALLPGRQID
jgi:S-adenosylmethionine-dependent methyltransferase